MRILTLDNVPFELDHLPEEVEDRIQKRLDEQEKKYKKIIKKKPLPPKPNKDTLGNDWTDWSADPNDLI